MWAFLLNGSNVLFSKLNVISRKFTIFKLEDIPVFNSSDPNA